MSQDRDALTMQLLLGIAAAKAGTVHGILSGILSSCISPHLHMAADQLSCVTAADVYRYTACDVCSARSPCLRSPPSQGSMSPSPMGVLLGMAAAKAGATDPEMSKMLFAHATSSLSCFWC